MPCRSCRLEEHVSTDRDWQERAAKALRRAGRSVPELEW